MFLSLIIMVVTLAANWRIFQKMGREGWEGLIPIYNIYVQFEELYGNGAKMFLLLIPFYNIYIGIKFYIDLAHAFNKSTGFGWGLMLLNVVFFCILAFSDAKYLDGSRAVVGNDAISTTLDSISNKTASSAQANTANAVNKSEYALSTLKELAKLREEGILTDEEFNEKKKDLLEMI